MTSTEDERFRVPAIRVPTDACSGTYHTSFDLVKYVVMRVHVLWFVYL